MTAEKTAMTWIDETPERRTAFDRLVREANDMLDAKVAEDGSLDVSAVAGPRVATVKPDGDVVKYRAFRSV